MVARGYEDIDNADSVLPSTSIIVKDNYDEETSVLEDVLKTRKYKKSLAITYPWVI